MEKDLYQEIVERFFMVLDVLIKTKKIRGVNTFTSRYGINRRNLCALRKEPWRKMFDISWLYYMVYDYGVNPYWVLSGKGEMFTKSAIDRINEMFGVTDNGQKA